MHWIHLLTRCIFIHCKLKSPLWIEQHLYVMIIYGYPYLTTEFGHDMSLTKELPL